MIHPDDAKELEEIANELGGECVRGPVRYPSKTGAWAVGPTDLGEWFGQFRDQEVVLVAVSVGEAAPTPLVCGVCGYEYDVVGPCPRCRRLNREEATRIKEKQRQWQEEVAEILRAVEDFLRSRD